MTDAEATEWLRRTENFARGDLDKVRSALNGPRAHPGLLFNDMRGALHWAVKHWLRRNGEELGPSWHDQEVRFLRVAPPNLREEYLGVAGAVTDLADGLLDQIAPGIVDIAITAPSLASWRNKADQWIEAAEGLIAKLAGPEAATPAPRGVMRAGRDALCVLLSVEH